MAKKKAKNQRDVLDKKLKSQEVKQKKVKKTKAEEINTDKGIMALLGVVEE